MSADLWLAGTGKHVRWYKFAHNVVYDTGADSERNDLWPTPTTGAGCSSHQPRPPGPMTNVQVKNNIFDTTAQWYLQVASTHMKRNRLR